VDDIGPCILEEEEVATAIKELKNNKAEGIDEIPAELLKCMGNTAVKVFTHLCHTRKELDHILTNDIVRDPRGQNLRGVDMGWYTFLMLLFS